MTDKNFKRIFADNLNRIMREREKTPANIHVDLGIPFSTISNWTNGAKLPRMGTVEVLARYLHCEKSDLLEEHSQGYYENQEVAKLAQNIKDNKELKALFDVQADMSADDLQALYAMALALKKKERPE